MLTPLVRAQAWALLLVITVLPLASPVVAQPARQERPVLPTAEDLGPGWVELPWTLPTGGPDYGPGYQEATGWYAGPYGSRIYLELKVAPERILDGLWTQIAEGVEDRGRSPLIERETLPPDTPPIEGCSEVRRAAGLSYEFPVLPEAITACRGSDAILLADVSGTWQGQDGVAASDALIRLLLDLRSSGGSMNGTATAGDRAALVPTPGAETPQKTPSPSRSLEDLVALFPSPEQLPAGMVLAEEGSLTASELAATFPDPDDAARVLDTWGWSLNAYRVYVADPDAGPETPTRMEISLHQFSSNSAAGCAACGAAYALSYFAHGRAVMLDQTERLAPGMRPCEAEVSGLAGNKEVTRYLRYGDLLVRVTTAMPNAPWLNTYYLVMGTSYAVAIAVMENAGGSVRELDQTCR